MSIIDSLKRLERAGSERSRATAKLCAAADEVGALIARALHEQGKECFGIWAVESASTYCSEPAHTWVWLEYDGERVGEQPDGQTCCREMALRLADAVANGLLDRIAEAFERDAAEVVIATATLEAAKIA